MTYMASSSGKRKQSLYFPEETLDQLNEEAERLDRSLSWLVQQAWKLSAGKIRQMPTAPNLDQRGAENERHGDEVLP